VAHTEALVSIPATHKHDTGQWFCARKKPHFHTPAQNTLSASLFLHHLRSEDSKKRIPAASMETDGEAHHWNLYSAYSILGHCAGRDRVLHRTDTLYTTIYSCSSILPISLQTLLPIFPSANGWMDARSVQRLEEDQWLLNFDIDISQTNEQQTKQNKKTAAK
jgi:hypothetical protein